MDLELDGKVAVVTGASKGIGLAVAAGLAAEGAHVVAGARRETPELAGLAEKYGLRFVPVDLATADGPAALVAAAPGRVDVLVNNVGASEPAADTLAFDDATWARIMDVTLFSAVRTTRAAAPLLSAGGAVVNVASLNSRLPAGNIAPYSAAKAALVNVSRALAEDLGPRGIRVNAISPGPVRTPMWTDPGAFAEMIAEQAGITAVEVMDRLLPESMAITLGRVAEPAEIADLVLFLCSARSTWITGVNYVVDGGMFKAAG